MKKTDIISCGTVIALCTAVGIEKASDAYKVKKENDTQLKISKLQAEKEIAVADSDAQRKVEQTNLRCKCVSDIVQCLVGIFADKNLWIHPML